MSEDPMWWIDEIGAIWFKNDDIARYLIYHFPMDWRRMLEARLSLLAYHYDK